MAFTDDRLRDELRRLPVPEVAEHEELQHVRARVERRRRAVRLRAGGVLVTLLAVVSGAAVVLQTDRTTVVTAEPGWDAVAKRRMPGMAVLTWVDGKLIVFGGLEGTKRLLNNGHAFDPAAGRWDDIPAAPFEHALFRPGSVVAGNALLVWGNECGRILEWESATLRCTGPQTFGVALYRPATRRWQKVAVPDDVTACGAVGWTGGRVVFGCDEELSVLDAEEGRWERLTVPFRARRVCAVEGAIVAADWTDHADAEAKREPEVIYHDGVARPSDMGLKAAVYDIAARRWSSPVSGPRAGAPFSTHSLCADTSLVVVGGEPGTPPTMTSGHRFDVGSRRWVPTAPPADAYVGWTAIWTGTEALVAGQRKGTAFGYDPSTDRWRLLSLPQAGPTSAVFSGVWVGDRVAFPHRGRLVTWVPGSP